MNGKDAVYIPLVENESLTPPEMDDHGVADLLNTHHFFMVDDGTPLMRRVPATAVKPVWMSPGRTFNRPREMIRGFPPNLIGVAVSPDDPMVLVAVIKGHPVLVHHGVNVDAILHMETGGSHDRQYHV